MMQMYVKRIQRLLFGTDRDRKTSFIADAAAALPFSGPLIFPLFSLYRSERHMKNCGYNEPKCCTLYCHDSHDTGMKRGQFSLNLKRELK